MHGNSQFDFMSMCMTLLLCNDRDRKKPSPFSKINEYKRVLSDEDIAEMNRITPRQVRKIENPK